MITDIANKRYSDVPDVLRGYLNYMTVIKGRSPNTVKEYYYDIKMFYRFLYVSLNNISQNEFNKIDLTNFDESILKNITLNDLYEFMAFVNNTYSSNDNYRARKVSSLRSYFNYLHSRLGFITSNPAADLDSPKIKKRMPRYLTVEELSELIGINLKNINL